MNRAKTVGLLAALVLVLIAAAQARKVEFAACAT